MLLQKAFSSGDREKQPSPSAASPLCSGHPSLPSVLITSHLHQVFIGLSGRKMDVISLYLSYNPLDNQVFPLSTFSRLQILCQLSKSDDSVCCELEHWVEQMREQEAHLPDALNSSLKNLQSQTSPHNFFRQSGMQPSECLS